GGGGGGLRCSVSPRGPPAARGRPVAACRPSPPSPRPTGGSSPPPPRRWRGLPLSCGSATSTTCADCRSASSAGWKKTAAWRSRTSFRAWPLDRAAPLPMSSRRRAAFLFSGQLAETIGMGRDFFEASEDARSLFSSTSERSGIDLEKILFQGPEGALHENLAAQAGV